MKAFAIDVFLSLILLQLFIYCFNELFAMTGAINDPFQILSQMFAMITTQILYFGLPYSKTGQTLGKKIVKISVVNLNKLTPPNLFLGSLRPFSQIMNLGIGFFFVFISKNKQTIHDYILDQVVIKR
jgi:uncharacterized RDD family membrane protein YckC